jgi:TetR/AcrR family tetracycline transcriptional repressor
MARPALTRDEVVRAALDLLDEVGLDAFTMRALATRLATYPATVYWHVGNRSQVLSAAGGLVLAEVAASLPDPAGTPWDDWLVENARAYRRRMLAHPALATWAVTNLEGEVPLPSYLEQLLGVLAGAGFRDADLVAAYNTYVGSLLGWVGLELIRADADHGADPEALQASIAALDADEHPTIVGHLDGLTNRAFTFRWETGVENPLDDAFEFALATWVKGLAAKLHDI